MATSKNNRKKGKKRTKGRAASQSQRSRTEVKRVRDWKSDQFIDFIALAVMVAGFLLACFTDYGVVGYPLAAVGAAIGLVRTKWDTTNHKITIVCYIVIIILLVLTWFGILAQS